MPVSLKAMKSVLIGKVVGVHALKGELRVLGYGDIDWIEGESLYTAREGKRPQSDGGTFKVASIRPHKGVSLVFFEGVSSIEEAKTLVGLCLYVDSDRLPILEPGEYYYQDLLDMEVFSESGQSIGKIAEVITTGANDVYQVLGPEGETLIPALKEVVLSVDIEKKKMVVKPVTYEPEDSELEDDE